ncbi:MAG: PAS domain S-box protein, partial [Anaerolineae bacterium]|nr:PAS domain S-box protein [Anaerolineae bacterium]
MIYTPFIWPLLIAAALMAGIALYAFRFWDVPAARSFSLLMGLASLWALIYAINISVTVLPLRIFLTLLVYVPMPFNAPVILILALEYTGYTPRLAQQRLWPLFVVPVITGLLSLTSNYHTLFLYDFRWDLSGPFPVLLCTEGPWYWVHIIYRLALLLIACGVLVSSLRARPLHVRNTILIALGIVIPMSADILFHAGITPILGYNFTPTMLVFTGLLYLWALLYFHLFDVVPVARYTIVEAMDDLVIVLDNRGHIVDFNHAAQEACGLTPLTIGATLATLPPAWAKALQRGSNPTLSQQEVTLDVGTGQRMYTVTSSPIQDKRDLTLGHLFLLHDITAFKQIEQELANTKTMLEATFAQTPIPMALISSPDNVIRITNPAIAAYLGIQDEPSRVGTQMIDLLHTRSWSDVDAQGNEVPPQQAPVTLALRGIATRNLEMGVVRKDGTRRWTLASTVPIYNQEGEQIAVHLAFPDITERKEAEAKLRQLSRAVEQSASTIVITDLEGTIEYVNPAFTRITGYTPEETIGKNPRVLKSGKHSREFYKKLWETILSGHEWQGEFLNRKKNGDLYWEHASISPVTDPSGKITNFVAVKEDITARKQAEETLRRYATELETRNQELDAFAHTVAHDL